jgi:hypothetical protein
LAAGLGLLAERQIGGALAGAGAVRAGAHGPECARGWT